VKRKPQQLGDPGPVRDPARRHDRHRDRVDASRHELGERHEREAVEERTAVPARLGSLRDDGVHTRVLQCPSLVRRRRRAEGDDASVPQRRRIDDPEREAEHRRALVEHDLEGILAHVRRREQVDGEGTVGRRPHFADRASQLVRRECRPRDRAERPRGGYRGRERRRRVVRHRRLHDREPDPDQLAQRRIEQAHAATSL
jgi:hypothetical protein